LYAWVRDRAGNVSRRLADAVFRDTRAPRPAITYPRVGNNLRELRRVGGVVSDPWPSSGGLTVTVAVVRLDDCAWWNPTAGDLVPGSCANPQWFGASVGGRTWSAAVGSLQATGRYRLLVRAGDSTGNAMVSAVAGATYADFTITPAQQRTRRR
jgi:hypothetical protein